MIKVETPDMMAGKPSGEQIEKQRQRRKALIVGGLAAVGFVGGFVVGFTEYEGLLEGGQTWPAPLSIALAIFFVVAMIGGGIAVSRHTDEVELQAQYKSTAIGAGIYMLVYPPWFLLWMADLVREPMHGVLFILFWLGLTVSSIFYRFR